MWGGFKHRKIITGMRSDDRKVCIRELEKFTENEIKSSFLEEQFLIHRFVIVFVFKIIFISKNFLKTFLGMDFKSFCTKVNLSRHSSFLLVHFSHAPTKARPRATCRSSTQASPAGSRHQSLELSPTACSGKKLEPEPESKPRHSSQGYRHHD